MDQINDFNNSTDSSDSHKIKDRSVTVPYNMQSTYSKRYSVGANDQNKHLINDNSSNKKNKSKTKTTFYKKPTLSDSKNSLASVISDNTNNNTSEYFHHEKSHNSSFNKLKNTLRRGIKHFTHGNKHIKESNLSSNTASVSSSKSPSVHSNECSFKQQSSVSSHDSNQNLIYENLTESQKLEFLTPPERVALQLTSFWGTYDQIENHNATNVTLRADVDELKAKILSLNKQFRSDYEIEVLRNEISQLTDEKANLEMKISNSNFEIVFKFK
jgi:cell division protein FtsB